METENTLPIVVILTAIPVEYQAVKIYLDDIKEDIANDGTIYEKGVFQSDGQDWTVVIRKTGPGNVQAANAVHLTWGKYQPDVMIFCGIAGGIKDTVIGDVVVADKVYNYHSGRVELDFSPRPQIYIPSQAIIERANLEGQSSELSSKEYKVLVKPIASGEELVASQKSETLERITKYYNDAVAIEMEGYGFLDAAQKCGVNERLLVRGISDLLDDKTETDKQGGQQLAMRNAASFAFQVLREFRPRLKVERKNLVEVRTPEEEDETTKGEVANVAADRISSGKIPELAIVERFRKELKKKGAYESGVNERVRLFVLAGSLLPANVDFRELQTHVLHKMYLNRNNEALTITEKRLVYTTLLRDTWDHKTGWFWLKGINIKRTVESLDKETITEMGEGTSKMLQMMEPSKAEASLVKIIKDSEHAQKRNILDYLRVNGSRKTLNVVEELTEGQHEGVTSKAILAKIGILSRYDPAQAVKILVEEATRNPKICEEAAIEEIVSAMNTRNLRKLVAINCSYVLKELAKRGKASEAELKSMLQSENPEIRYLGYSVLLKRGTIFDPEDIQEKWPKSQGVPMGFFIVNREIIGKKWLEKAVFEAYLKMPMSELEGSVELKSRRGVVYLAWGLSGGVSVAEIIRSDIKNNFKRHKVNSLAGIEEEVARGTEGNQQRIESLQNSERSMTKELTVSALKLLKKYGKASDKMIAKTFLKSEDTKVRAAAVALFAEYAGKRDIVVLSEIVNGGGVGGQIVAAKTILKLDGGKERSRDLLKSNYSDIVKEAICWYIANKERLDWNDISTLLYSKNEEVRLLATAYAAKTWTRRQLISLLKKYLNEKTYYYNVVCWLDRVLYAPKDLAQGYKKKLTERLDNLSANEKSIDRWQTGRQRLLGS